MGDDVPKDQQGPPPAEAAKAETRLKGHLGHLTPEEEKALEQFKKISIKEGFYTPATDEARASHDDGTLMFVVNLSPIQRPAVNAASVGTYELESSSLKMPSPNSRTQNYGERRIALTPCTRR
jgi:hypothetical protein